MSEYEKAKSFVQRINTVYGHVPPEELKVIYDGRKAYIEKVELEARKFLTKAHDFRAKDFTTAELPIAQEVILEEIEGLIAFNENFDNDGEPDDEDMTRLRNMRENLIFTAIENTLLAKVPGYQLPAGLHRVPPLAERLLDPIGTSAAEVTLEEAAEAEASGPAADPVLDASAAASADGVAHASAPEAPPAVTTSTGSVGSAARNGAGLFGGTEARQAGQVTVVDGTAPASSRCGCSIM